MVRIIVGIVLVLLIGYGAVKAWPLVQGPTLSIQSPEAYAAIPHNFVVVSGTAKHTETLYLNGGPLLIDPEGHFEKTLVLPSGGAILSLTATDRFGRSVTERRTIFIP